MNCGMNNCTSVFQGNNYDFQENLESKEFVARLAYLLTSLKLQTHFNMSFQGSNGTLSEKLEAFVRKLALWIENVKNKKYAVFKLFISVRTNLIMNFLKKFSEEIF